MITKYKVLKLSSHPMYGRDKVLRVFDDFESALNHVNKYHQNKDDIAIFEFRYACQENLKKDFHFNYSLVWASYL